MNSNPEIPSSRLVGCKIQADQHVCKAYTSLCRNVIFYNIWAINHNMLPSFPIPTLNFMGNIRCPTICCDVNWFVIKLFHDDETRVSISSERIKLISDRVTFNKITTTWKLLKKCMILFMAISSKSLFDRMVPSAVIPRAFSLIIRGIVVNQLSKHKVWCLCCGRCFTNRITDPSDEQFSAPTLPLPLHKKKLYIIPDAPALTIILNPHFTGFLGLYCRIPLLLVLAGWFVHRLT